MPAVRVLTWPQSFPLFDLCRGADVTVAGDLTSLSKVDRRNFGRVITMNVAALSVEELQILVGLMAKLKGERQPSAAVHLVPDLLDLKVNHYLTIH